MRFGTTFRIYGLTFDVEALKHQIDYQAPKDQAPNTPWITVYNDTDQYQMVLAELQTAHVDYHAREFVEYTKAETESALYYELKLIFPFQGQDKVFATDFGVEYRYSCDCCKRHSKILEQTSPMKLDLKKIGKWQMFIAPPEFIVREDVKEIIEQEGLSGVQFSKVLDYKNRDIESSHYQLLVDHILPPMNKYTIQSDGGSLPCKECGSTAIYLENPISYTRKDLEKAKDFNLSQEHIFNHGMRVLVISKRARDIIKGAVRRCNPVPVLVEDGGVVRPAFD